MKLCSGAAVSVRSRPAGGQSPVDVLGGFLGAGNQRDVLAHDEGDHAGQQRVVGAAEHHGVHPGGNERRQVVAGDGEQFRPGGDAGLHVRHERRAGHGRDLQVRGRGEGVLVGARAHRGRGPDHAHPARPGRRDGTPHGRLDHFDHGDAVPGRVPFAGVPQHGGGRGVAGDGQQLHAGVHELVHDAEGVGPDFGDGKGAVGAVGGVADIQDGFVGQLVDDRAGHREAADAGVEDADGARCQPGVLPALPAGESAAAAAGSIFDAEVMIIRG